MKKNRLDMPNKRPPDSVRLRARQLRKARGLTLEQVAALVGTDPINISRVERGTQGYTGRMLSGIAKALGVRVSELFEDYPVELESALLLRPFRNVPVRGEVKSEFNGHLEELPSTGDEGVITFPARHSTAYALRVRGDAMRPRIRPGEFIIVEPQIEPTNGDDVVVVCKNGVTMLKTLLYKREDGLALASVAPDFPIITLALDEIAELHYVAAIVPSAAFYRPKK